MIRTQGIPELAGLTRGQELHRQVDADPSAGLVAGVLAPGGCGKTALLEAVSAVYREAGVPVAGADALTEGAGQVAAADAAFVIDDAHELGPEVLQLVHERAGEAGSRLIVAFRPWPRSRALSGLTQALRRSGSVVVLEHLDRDGVAVRAAAALGRTPPSAWLDVLADRTAGQPMLLDEVLSALQETSEHEQAAPVLVPQQVENRLRLDVEDLDDDVRALMLALAVGSTLESELVSPLLGIDPGSLGRVVDEARATGFLLPDGRLVPLFRDAVLAGTPTERTRAVQSELLELQAARGGDVVQLARALVEGGTRGHAVADALERGGDARLREDPHVAGELYRQAVAAGASSERLAVRRAEAAALDGQLDLALRLTDPVLADPDSPDLARGIEVAATALSHRGLVGRAAELYGWLGPARVGRAAPLAALALLANGSLDAAGDMMRAPSSGAAPTMVAGATALMAQGIWQSVNGSSTLALSALSRATTLLEPAARGVLLPDTPAALTALVALHVGELDLAESALRQGITQQQGGAVAQTRHHLLLAWTEMLRGRVPAARDWMARARRTSAVPEPRDELFVQALEVGLARRASDVPALVQAWSAAREAIVRHPVDLFVLLPLGELTVAAARLRDSERLAPHLDEAWRLLAGVGDPALWATPLHWYCVQAAILSERTQDIEPHATPLARAARHSHYAGVLATAGRSWMRVLADKVEPGDVMSAARGLATVGLAWDGSRLLGAAAGRSTDRREMSALLQAARALQETETPAAVVASDRRLPDEAPAPVPSPAPGLSARELEIADLLLRNRTYREIGESLYISPKTVEHHVARMKQRLGASGRSDLFSQLAAVVGPPAQR